MEKQIKYRVPSSITKTTGSKERLSKDIKDKLNTQIENELYAAHLYRSAYIWAKFNGLTGTAKFLENAPAEETGHANKVYSYLMDKNCMPITPAVKAPINEFKGIKDIIEKGYEHEIFVTTSYNELADLALKNKDYSTLEFAQSVLKEQVEEEAKFLDILDRIEFLEKEGVGLLEIDHELGD